MPDVPLCAAGAMVNGNVYFPQYKAFIGCPTPHTWSMIICQYTTIQKVILEHYHKIKSQVNDKQ